MFKLSLKAARVNTNLTQNELAEKMHVTKQTVLNWEKGKHTIGIPELEMFCKICNVPKDYIFLPHESTISKHELSNKIA